MWVPAGVLFTVFTVLGFNAWLNAAGEETPRSIVVG